QDGFTASYDPRTGKAISRLLSPSQDGGGRVPSDIAFAEVSPDTSKAALLDRAGTIHIWDLLSGKRLREIVDPFASPRLRSWGTEASFSPDGSRLVHVRLEKGIQIWDWATSKLLGRLPEVEVIAKNKEEALDTNDKGMGITYRHPPRAFSAAGRLV